MTFAVHQKHLIDSLRQRAKSVETSEKISQTFKASILDAFLIRCVERKLLNLFAEAKVSGTVHTCIGQEMTGVAVANFLRDGDWVTSNHRCHGHFIAKTGNWMHLIDELLGLSSGISKGIGSSQHLYQQQFISNGTQGSLVPVASGLSLAKKKQGSDNIAVSFIGEGTLGEGNIYEAMNLSALFYAPHLIVCENNYYSQTTPQGDGVGGSIELRARAFGLEFFDCDTWNLTSLFETVGRAVEFVRKEKRPAFLKIDTYRLMAHSKGDDDRDREEVGYFEAYDLINRLREHQSFKGDFDAIEEKVNKYADSKLACDDRIDYEEYSRDQLPRQVSAKSRAIVNNRISMVKALQGAYYDLAKKKSAVFIGEDIADPYGGAFKVTKGIQTEFPAQVYSTSISEAGLVGMAIGMSLEGRKAFAEIMFGDFVVNAMDQIINNASKFYHMYGYQLSCDVTIRTPMGGRRGYGPTHSQTLDKFLIGIDNVACIALSSLIDPTDAIFALSDLKCPKIVIENKTDYSSFLYRPREGLSLERIGGGLGTGIVKPQRTNTSVAIICYGYLARLLADNYEDIFRQTDLAFTIICPQLLHPLPLAHFQRVIKNYSGVVVAEESTAGFGWSDGVIAELIEVNPSLKFARLASDPVPIPSHRETELLNLVSVQKAIEVINRLKEQL